MSNKDRQKEDIIDKIKRVGPPLEEYIDTSGDEWSWISKDILQGPHPIHGSTTGKNFTINTNRQIWRCYRKGHNVRGSIMDFVAMESGIIRCEEADDIPQNKWREIFQVCCKKFDIENEYEGTTSKDLNELKEKRKEKMKIYDLLTEFSKLAHSRLDEITWDEKSAREHLKDKRSFSDEIIDELKIGFWDSKVTEKLVDNYETEELVESGLFVIPSKLNEKIDSLINLSSDSLITPLSSRIIYPYWKGGSVVYLIGRKTPITEWQEGPKYIKLRSGKNHERVSDYIKNDVFYGEDSALNGLLLITEGVTDCISLLDAGYNAISPVTTKFRERDKSKLLELTEYSDEIVVINDNEKSKAGEKGALQTARTLFEAGRNVRISFPPKPEDVDKVDVDDYLTEHNNSSKAVERILESSMTYIDYRIDNLRKDDLKGSEMILEELIGADYLIVDQALNKLEKKACVSKEVLNRKFKDLGGKDNYCFEGG